MARLAAVLVSIAALGACSSTSPPGSGVEADGGTQDASVIADAGSSDAGAPDAGQVVAGFQAGSIDVGGQARTYQLYVPSTAGSRPLPLVLALHGHGGSALQMSGQQGTRSAWKVWTQIADREGLLVAYLDGLPGGDSKPGWNDCRADGTTNPTSDDVAFVSALIDTLSQRFTVDSKRVYAGGMSNGGVMTLRLAIELPARIAAFAAVAANMAKTSECAPPAVPTSVLFMHGTADPIMPYDGGAISGNANNDRGTVLSMSDSLKIWQGLDGTSATPISTPFADLDTGDGCTVHEDRYTSSSGTEVVLIEVAGGGHTEPSIQEHLAALYLRLVGPQDHDVESAEELWRFFKDKHLP